jgi:hypothetical protein
LDDALFFPLKSLLSPLFFSFFSPTKRKNGCRIFWNLKKKEREGSTRPSPYLDFALGLSTNDLSIKFDKKGRKEKKRKEEERWKKGSKATAKKSKSKKPPLQVRHN